MGKDLTELRNPHRELVPDRVGLEEHEPTFLREIATKAKANRCLLVGAVLRGSE
jgi:hypothetical protein